MKLLEETGKASYNDKQIESACEKLLFVLTLADKTKLADVKLDVKINDRNTGTKSIIPNLPLGDLFEIAAANEGFTVYRTVGANTVISGTVELSNDGALLPESGYISASVSGMVTTDKLEIYVMDDAETTKEYIEYETVYIQPDSVKELMVEKNYQISMRKDVSLFDIKYINGRQVSYTAPELNYINDEINPLSYVDYSDQETATIKTGASKFFSLGILGAVQLKIKLATAGNIYLIKNKTLEV